MENSAMDLLETRRWAALSQHHQTRISRGQEGLGQWRLYALSLISAQNYELAVIALQKVLKEDPNDVAMHLLLAKISALYLGEYDLAATSATSAYELRGPLFNKSSQYLGVSYGLRARMSLAEAERRENHTRALELFEQAANADTKDSKAHYNAALQYAHSRDIAKSLRHVKQSVRLDSECVHSYVLLALLYSSMKDYAAALDTCRVGLAEHPNHIMLLIVTAQVFVMLDDKAKAINVFADALSACKLSQPSNEEKSRQIETHSASISIPELDDLIDDFRPKQKHPAWKSSWQLYLEQMIEIWCCTVRCYLLAGMTSDAITCVTEAKALSPLSPQVIFLEGLIAQSQLKTEEAMLHFTNALSIDSNHVDSLIQLAVLYSKRGDHQVAKGYLETAIQIDEYNHIAWFHTAQNLQAMGDYDTAVEAFHTALSLEATAPAYAFSNLSYQL